MKKISLLLTFLLIPLLFGSISALDLESFEKTDLVEHAEIINNYLETVDMNELPFFVRFITSGRNLNMVIEEDFSNNVYGFSIKNNQISTLNNGGFEKVRTVIYVSGSVLDEIGQRDDVDTLLKESYDKGDIYFQQFGFFSPITSFLLNIFFGETDMQERDEEPCLEINGREYYAQDDTSVKKSPTSLSRNVCELRRGDTVYSSVNDLYDVQGGFIYIVVKDEDGNTVCCGYVPHNKIGTGKMSRDIGASEATEAERGVVTGRMG